MLSGRVGTYCKTRSLATTKARTMAEVAFFEATSDRVGWDFLDFLGMAGEDAFSTCFSLLEECFCLFGDGSEGTMTLASGTSERVNTISGLETNRNS